MRSLKYKKSLRALTVSVGFSIPFASTLSAADIFKANNTDDLNSTSSWDGGVVPTSQDVAVWDSRLTTPGSLFTLSASTAWGGLKVVNNVDELVITDAIPFTTTINIGLGGVNMSEATSGNIFAVFGPTISMPAGRAQNWSIADGARFYSASSLTLPAGATINFDLGVTGTGRFIWGGGTANSILSYVTVNKNDFAAYVASPFDLVGAPQSTAMAVVPAASVGLSVPNPTDGGDAALAADILGAPAAGSYLDVTNSNGLATATAFRAFAGFLPDGVTRDAGTYWTNSGIRFNQPHATEGIDWIVDVTQKSLYASAGVFSLLVTENVGARNVIFNGGNNGNAFRYNNSGATLLVQQNNTQADLILRSTFSARQTNNGFVKSGPGRLIMGNGGFGGTGTVYLNQGVTQLGENNATGTFGGYAVVNNGTLRILRSDAFTFANNLGGQGPLLVGSSGVGGITLSGANTYTGATTIESGFLTLGSPTALGATSSLTLNGGLVTFGSLGGVAVNTDITAFPVTVGTTTTFDTNGNDVVFANSITESAPSGLVKSGAGSLTLAAANTLTGSSSVNAGTLAITNTSGSAIGTGALAVNNGTLFTGTGSVAGAVTVAGGAKVVPGSGGVGTLTVGGLNLQSGSLLDLEVTNTSSNDRIVVTGSGGLAINGGAINFFGTGTSNGLSTPGVYNLFQYNGAIGGAGTSALSVLNPQAGYRYTFGTASGFVTLTVNAFGMITNWVTSGSGSFSGASNWSNGVPSGDGATANFTASLAGPATVTLDGNRTLGGLSLDSANPYTIAQGSSGTLFLDNGTDLAAINILNGAHTISAPVGIVSNISVSTVANTSLSFTGLVAGIGNVTKLGAGTLAFSNTNQIVGNTIVSGGSLEFGSLASIGDGSIELNGGALRYATGNTADISARQVIIGVNGGGIDTNGNNVTFANPIGNSGAGSLIKKGSGTLSLAAANTYVGPTVIQGGKLAFAANTQLNAPGVGITLDGGTLDATATFATDRVITTSATGGTVAVATGATFTVTPALAGTGVLTKSGAGILTLGSTGATKTGGLTLQEGILRIGTNVNFGASASVLGTGTVTLSGGILEHAYAAANTLIYDNAMVTAASTRSSVVTPNRFRWNGAVSGTGDLDVSIATNAARADFQNNFTGFTGNLNLTGTGTARFGIAALGSNQPLFNAAGLSAATLSLDGIATTVGTNSGGNTMTIGSLTSTGSTGTLGGGTAGTLTYSIGGLNATTTFGGSITGNATLTKTGTGTLTLTHPTGLTYTGATNVNGGTLTLLGAKTGAGAVTVAAAGTLTGNGSIAGPLTVNGVLHPDSTGALGGQFTIGGAGAFTLASTATTQIDFGNAVYTGIKSTSTGANTYGGLLKFNFKGTVFDGVYKIFELTTAPTGAFTGVSVTTLSNTETTLGNSGTVWSGPVGLQTYSFDASTGTLTVTGGSTAVTPVASTLSAVAGNAKVDLSWTSASGANTYTVKRATVSGGPYTNLVSNLAGTTYSDITATNGTIYYYVVQGKNTASGLSGVNSNEVSATPVAAPVHTALEQWRFDEFGVYADDGNVLAGNTEDFDGDGLVNILEYALGTDPTVANASPVVVGRTGNNLTLTYPRRTVADAALTYSVLGSSDLTTAFTAGAGATNTVGNTSTYTDNVDLSVAGTRRFLRLSVTYTAP